MAVKGPFSFLIIFLTKFDRVFKMLRDKIHDANDLFLLSEMRAGNRAAFDSLYEKYKKDVFNEAYKRLSDADLAKDVTQDVFTSLWIKGSENEINNLPGYLYISIKNNTLRLMQRQSKFIPIPDLLEELDNNRNRADAEMLYKELTRAYDSLIESLPEQQRVIYKMRYNDHLTPDEIAQQLEISPKTVRNHLGKAITRLKAAMMLIQLLYLVVGKH
ncbi:MAG TPA: sigma-70 family RNA polymerase sigma factor [Mucilaginibacter sp.]|nr:sigma-70 family RNA polymerase sigma factor [Mucilaginibacter sp.]